MSDETEDKKLRNENPRVMKALEANDMEALAEALSENMRRFSEEYILDFNGAAAAVRAGYAPNFADRQAHVVLQNKGVQAYISHLIQKRAASVMAVNPDYVLRIWTEMLNKPGVKDADKIRITENLAKYLGMFIERQEITGKDGGAIEIQQQKVEEEARDFTDKLRSLSEKTKPKEVDLLD